MRVLGRSGRPRFPQGFLCPPQSWISSCLSELDKAMEKVRLWLATGREAWGTLGIFLPTRDKSVLYLARAVLRPRIQELMRLFHRVILLHRN